MNLRLPAAALALIATLTPAGLHAQGKNTTATATPVTATTTALGSSATGTVTFTFASSVTVGGVTVLTQGSVNYDFALNSTSPGTCTAKTYSSGNTCTVGYTFTPTAPGLRFGAAYLEDASNNIIATALITGIGTAAQLVNTSANTLTAFPQTLTGPWALARDSAGFLYVLNDNAGTLNIDKYTASTGAVSSGCASCLTIGTSTFGGVAVGGDGYVYVSIPSANTVTRFPQGFTTSTTLNTLNTYSPVAPGALVFDASGNLYVAETGSPYTIDKISATGVKTTFATLSATTYPTEMLFDLAGNMFFTDITGSIREIAHTCTSACSTALVYTYTTGNKYTSLGIDIQGNLFAGTATGLVEFAYPAYTSTSTLISSGLSNLVSIAVDSYGNVYLADNNSSGGQVSVLTRNSIPVVTAAATNEDTTTAQQTVTFTNTGNATATATGTSVSGNAVAGATDTCKTAAPIAIASTCTVGIEFDPVVTGSPQTGTLTLAGNFVSPTVTISGAVSNPPSQLVFATAIPSTLTAGTSPGTITIQEQTSSGTVSTSAIAVTLTVTSVAGYSATYGPTAAVNGSISFNPATLTVAGTYTYTATATGLNTATSSQVLSPAATSRFTVTPSNLYVFQSTADTISIAAFDAYNNATTTTDTVQITSTDAAATLPANFALVSGTGAATVTFHTAGSQTVTVTDVNHPTVATTSAAIAVDTPASFTVTTVTDDNTSPSASHCTNQSANGSTQDSACSLRDAFLAAEAAGLDYAGITNVQPTINFKSGISSPISMNAVITVTANASLVGPGASTLTIQPSTNGFAFLSSTTANVADSISGLTISGFSSTSSGGALAFSGNPNALTVSNSTFTNNATSSLGGAIWDEYGTLTISNSTFSGNAATNGGAVVPQNGVAFTLTGDTFYGNSASGIGGAVEISTDTSSTITNCTFGTGTTTGLYNTAGTYGGAVYVAGSPGTVLNNNTFTGNTAGQAAGAFYMSVSGLAKATAPATGNTFTSNRVTAQTSPTLGGGGALFFLSTPYAYINLNSFIGNSVTGTYASGGAVEIYGGSPNFTINNSLFSGNQITNTSASDWGDGGAIYQASGSSISNLSSLTLIGDTFTGNLATGISTTASSTNGSIGGGAIFTGTFVADTFTNDTFTANRVSNSANATYASGGAILMTATNSSYNPTLYNTIVAGNSSSGGYPDVVSNWAVTTCNSAYCNKTSTTLAIDSAILLAPLANYGGTLLTYFPLPGSPAIAGGSTTVTGAYTTCNSISVITDARGCGYSRTATDNGQTYIDAGAVQTNYTLAFVNQPTGATTTSNISGSPSVQLYESGIPFTTTGGTITIADTNAALTPYTIATTASGIEAINVTIPTTVVSDALVAYATSGVSATGPSVTSNTFNPPAPADPIDHITITGPTHADTGTQTSYIVTAYDASNLILTSFTGAVTLTSSDAAATLPSTYTFTGPDAGIHTFAVSFATVGTQSVTATTNTAQTATANTTVLANNVWLVNYEGSLSKVTNSGVLSVSPVGSIATASSLGGIAIDSAGNVWSVSNANNTLDAITYSGTNAATYPTGVKSNGGLNAPVSVAIDGNNSIWIANSGNASVSAFTNSGTAVSPSTGYGITAIGTNPSAIVIDNAGGVWVTSKTANSVTHVIGAATPVTTPLSAAITNSTLAAKP